ncbi:MAG: flagellar M-ring protein FliF [Dysosmobacter sp.]|nr:flagellar M-ring protein FliF [Dysosmobacter sp.]
MKEKAKALFDKTKERLKKVSRKIWIVIAAVLVVLIVAIAIVLTLNKQDYAVLVTQVSNTEASTILNFLSNRGVTDYKVEDGNTILVPAGQESALKAGILMENLNQTGHYYLENIGSFSTNEERKTAYLLDLQTNMAATIRSFPNVVEATVNITPGENRAYILDSNNVVEASAAVNVTMVEGQMLTDGQAEAIQHFVSHSVQGLEIDSVSITDTVGNVYLTGDALNGEASALKIQLQQAMENRIRTQVMNVLSPFFGQDNVRVGVTCEVEVNRTTEERNETILPPYAQDGSTDGRGIVVGEDWSYYVGRPGEELPGGLVGTESNADLPEQVEAAVDPEEGDRALGGTKRIDYDNTHSVINIDNNGAVKMTDCSVAVSVNARTAGDFNVDAIRQHVARAANITGELDPVTGEEILNNKISVVSMEFYDPTRPPADAPDDGLKVDLWILIAAGVGLLLFIILLTVILLLRRKKRRKQAEEEARQREEAEALLRVAGLGLEGGAPESGADVMDLEMERSMELRKDIRQFASDNPEIAAQMIKAWLKGGDGNG